MTEAELIFLLRFSLHKRVEWPAEDDYERIGQIFGADAKRIAAIDGQFQQTVSGAAAQLQKELPTIEFAGAKGKIVFVGDSNTSCRTGYRAIITEYMKGVSGIECVDKSLSCEKSTEAVFEFQNRVLDQEPDVVSIMIGTNGVRRANFPGAGPIVSFGDFEEHLRLMVSLLTERKVKVILNTLPPMIPSNLEVSAPGQSVSLEDIKGYNDIVRRIAREYGCTLNDAVSALGDGSQTLEQDGIHLNDAGQLIMARMVLNSMLAAFISDAG